jgi:hypothetical protein
MFKYKIGTVVRDKYHKKYGHIVGFAENQYETCTETILVVKWQDGREYKIHPNNVILE